ncbi:MAG: OmpA family protein, partial [Gemmatimonadetes bacterium]|nr:OmpA family protein [Gemmatimonadota bacterium]
MSHGTRGGRVADYTEAWEQEEAKLYDFGINSAQLGEAHRRWLSNRVVPILVRGGSITVVGEASRTGSFRHNDALSLRRAKAVLAYLRSA